jgi:hypothetical protein
MGLVAAATIAAAAAPIEHLSRDTDGWATFLVLTGAAAAAQLFVARTPRTARYYTTIVFLTAGVLLLPLGLVALLGIVQHVPEWLKMRYPRARRSRSAPGSSTSRTRSTRW